MLEINDLCLNFGGLKVSDHISLTIEAGTIHALIGPNGAGKTTLINQIYGDLRSDSGRILLAGEEIHHLSIIERVHKGLARSFQISNLLMEFTVIEHVILAILGHRRATMKFFKPAFSDPELIAKAETHLQQVDMFAQKDVHAATLSHGERRLLELSLALVGEPKLLLLDEPMAGTSRETSHIMHDLITRFRGGVSILLVEHDMDAVFALADHITVLADGRVLACGTPTEISASSQVRATYLGHPE